MFIGEFNSVNIYFSVCFDSIYYFIHRFVHETPVLYKVPWRELDTKLIVVQSIHKRHHDLLPVDVFLTGKY